MQLGMVGLGRMGANIVRRLMRDGHECVVYDVGPEVVAQLESEGATGSSSLDEFVQKLEKPRAAWVMIPAGITGKIVDDLAERMERRRHHHRRRQQLLPRRHRPRKRPVGEGHPLRRRRHERRRVRSRARLLPDDRRRGRDRATARSDLPLACSRRGRCSADARTKRERNRAARLSALRASRRRPLREDGSQRDRVRRHGRVRRRA